MKKIFSFLIVSIYFSLFCFTQPTTTGGNFPCGPDVFAMIGGNGVVTSSSSSTSTTNWQFVVDGNYSSEAPSASTLIEDNAWVEVDLQELYFIENMAIYYPSSDAEQMDDYYILTSSMPFASDDLSTNLNSSSVNYLHVAQSMPSGLSIPLTHLARYVRIQNGNAGGIPSGIWINEIMFTGGPGGGGDPEICGDGDDNDCDGLIDCEDPDCVPTIFNIDVDWQSSCLPDGSIKVQAFGTGPLRFELFRFGNLSRTGCDILSGGSCTFSNLFSGVYIVRVTDEDSQCFVESTIELESVTSGGDPDSENDDCTNGGFENGNFNGWTGSYGTYGGEDDREKLENCQEDGNLDITTGIDPQCPGGQHEVISANSGYTDPSTSDLDLFNNSSGNNIARLGDTGDGSGDRFGISTLNYCFEVTAQNADFAFSYSVVLEDVGHDPIDQPYFQYQIRNETTGEMIREPERRIAGNDPLFLEGTSELNGLNIEYSPMDCSSTSLSEYIGDIVCVDFEVRDCCGGPHNAYAYIDGLCNSDGSDGSGEGRCPTADFDFTTTSFCEGQDIIISDIDASKFNRISWEVCEKDPTGNQINCVEEQLTTVNGLEDFNVGNFYSNLICGKDYVANLTLSNSCCEEIFPIDFTYSCEPGPVIDYQDILNCVGENANITMVGTNNCPSCAITWTPGNYLDDHSIPFPTTQGSTNVLANYQDYHVIVENALGCKAEDDVTIYNRNDIDIEIWTVNLDECDFSTLATIALTNPVSNFNLNNIEVIFTVSDPSGNLPDKEYIGTPLSTSRNSSYFQLPMRHERTKDHVIKVEVRAFFGEDGGIGTCVISETLDRPRDSPFFDNMTFYAPSSFCPPCSTFLQPCREFNPFFGNNIFGEKNVYSASIYIVDRWGNEAHIASATAPVDGPGLTGEELVWDGYINGQLGNSGVYTWVLEYNNCDFYNSVESCDNCDDYPDVGVCCTNGDITLLHSVYSTPLVCK